MSDKMILPGLPQKPDPTAGVALPMMRGFACPVAAPFMDQGGPPEGIGVGWSNVLGHGVKFFVTVHAEGGFALVAQLDYARYERLCRNLASIGQQAMLTGDLETKAEGDVLGALGVTYEALVRVRDEAATDAPAMWDQVEDAITTAAKALMIEPKEQAHDD